MPDESLDLRPCCSEISTMAENKKLHAPTAKTCKNRNLFKGFLKWTR